MPSGPVDSARRWSGLDVKNLKLNQIFIVCPTKRCTVILLVLSIRSAFKSYSSPSCGFCFVQWCVVANVRRRVRNPIFNLESGVRPCFVLHTVLLPDIVYVDVLPLNPSAAVGLFSSCVCFCLETKAIARVVLRIC